MRALIGIGLACAAALALLMGLVSVLRDLVARDFSPTEPEAIDDPERQNPGVSPANSGLASPPAARPPRSA